MRSTRYGTVGGIAIAVVTTLGVYLGCGEDEADDDNRNVSPSYMLTVVGTGFTSLACSSCQVHVKLFGESGSALASPMAVVDNGGFTVTLPNAVKAGNTYHVDLFIDVDQDSECTAGDDLPYRLDVPAVSGAATVTVTFGTATLAAVCDSFPPSNVTPACDGTGIVDGDHTVVNPQALANCTRVAGSLTVQNNSVTALSLPSLQTIDGDLNIKTNTNLTSVTLAGLTTVGQQVEVSGNTVLTTLTAGALERVGGIAIKDNPALNQCTAQAFIDGLLVSDPAGGWNSGTAAYAVGNMSPCAAVSGVCSGGTPDCVTDCAQGVGYSCEAANVGDLTLTLPSQVTAAQSHTAIAGDLVIDQTALTSVSLPNLRIVDGNVRITANTNLATLDLSGLESVSGTILIDANAFSTLDLSSLETAGAIGLSYELGDMIMAQGSPLLTAVTLTALTRFTGAPFATGGSDGGIAARGLYSGKTAVAAYNLPLLENGNIVVRNYRCQEGNINAPLWTTGAIIVDGSGYGCTATGPTSLSLPSATTITAPGLVIGGTKLTSLAGLASAVTVEGSLNLWYNGNLTTLGLTGLTTFNGNTFNVESNPQLPDCDIEDLVNRLDCSDVASSNGNLDPCAGNPCNPNTCFKNCAEANDYECG